MSWLHSFFDELSPESLRSALEESNWSKEKAFDQLIAAQYTKASESLKTRVSQFSGQSSQSKHSLSCSQQLNSKSLLSNK